MISINALSRFYLFAVIFVLVLLSFNPFAKTSSSSSVASAACISNDIFSDFELRSPRNGSIVDKRVVSLEIELKLYVGMMERFTAIRDTLSLCVVESISGGTFCFDGIKDDVLTAKEYTIKQMKNQSLSVSLCQKKHNISNHSDLSFSGNSISRTSDDANNQCFCTHDVDIIPRYQPSCIDNLLINKPFLETSYTSVPINPDHIREFRVSIIIPLVEHYNSDILDSRRLSSISSIFDSIKAFRSIINNSGGQKSTNLYFRFVVDLNVIISSSIAGAKSVTKQSQNQIIEFLQDALHDSSKTGTDGIFVYQCPDYISDCIIPTIMEGKKDCPACADDDNIIIVTDPDNHMYTKEAVHDMVDSMLESEACFSFFTSDSEHIDTNKLIKDGSLHHYTVGAGRRPTRWSELPDGWRPPHASPNRDFNFESIASSASVISSRGTFLDDSRALDFFLDSGRDFSAKMETIRHFSILLSQMNGDTTGNGWIQIPQSVGNLIQLAHASKDRFGQRIASLTYPWPSSARPISIR